MIEPTRAQLSFAEGLIEEEVGPLWEEWMREVDELLADRDSCRSSTRLSLGVAPTAARGAALARRLMWCCGFCF